MLGVVILLEDIVAQWEKSSHGWPHVVNEDLTVLLLLHDPVNTVQVTNPVCGEATPHHNLFVVFQSSHTMLRIVPLTATPPDTLLSGVAKNVRALV
jgi:hypothetical protein